MSLGHTCGPQCWTAQDDICSCSCGGANHGCLRTIGGVAPVRSRKMEGRFYELHSVHHGYAEINNMRMTKPNSTYPPGGITKTATEAEIQKWPELTAYRNIPRYERYIKPVVCVWVPTNKYQ